RQAGLNLDPHPLWHGLRTVPRRRTEGLRRPGETLGQPGGRVGRPAHSAASEVRQGGDGMSSVALLQPAVGRRAINPWVVAVAVVIPTFMEVLDTTIANVALRYIAGGLSAAVIDAEWVLTSYLAANATILPISGWLSAHLGRRNYFLLSIALFT